MDYPGAAVQTTVDPNATPVTDPGDPATSAPASTPCATCGAPMLEDQDWCLSCGTAAAGRLGRRPGSRTMTAVAAVTLLLVAAAVIVSYSALQGDATHEAGKAAGPSATPLPGQVAQVPDAAPPTASVPPSVSVPPTASTTPPPTAGTTATGVPSLPTLPSIPSAPVVPVTPTTSTTTPTTTTTTTTNTTSTSTGSTSTSTGTTTPAKVTLTPIALGADAVDKYDPSKRIVSSTDPADAYDDNAKTAWTVTTPDDGYDMQVGLLIDLDTAKNVKEIYLGTTTPGGRVEVYGAVGSALPEDILDTRWEHVMSTSKIDANDKYGNKKGDGLERIRLPGPGAKGSRFRHVLLWFTTPPTKGPTMKVNEVKLTG
jgi:hypothetical protein